MASTLSQKFAKMLIFLYILVNMILFKFHQDVAENTDQIMNGETLLTCFTNTYQIMYVETIDFQCQHQ